MAESLPPVGSTGSAIPFPPEGGRTVSNRELSHDLAPKGIANPRKAIGEPLEAIIFTQAIALRGLRYGP